MEVFFTISETKILQKAFKIAQKDINEFEEIAEKIKKIQARIEKEASSFAIVSKDIDESTSQARWQIGLFNARLLRTSKSIEISVAETERNKEYWRILRAAFWYNKKICGSYTIGNNGDNDIITIPTSSFKKATNFLIGKLIADKEIKKRHKKSLKNI